MLLFASGNSLHEFDIPKRHSQPFYDISSGEVIEFFDYSYSDQVSLHYITTA